MTAELQGFSAEKSAPCCSGFLEDEILPSCVGIIS